MAVLLFLCSIVTLHKIKLTSKMLDLKIISIILALVYAVQSEITDNAIPFVNNNFRIRIDNYNEHTVYSLLRGEF